MKRENTTNEGIVKQFNNDNINISLSDDAIENIQEGRWSDIEVISWLLDTIDTSFVGEEFCLSNYDMGAMLYDCYSDRVFIISFNDIHCKLLQGKTLKLFAAGVDDDTRGILEKEGY